MQDSSSLKLIKQTKEELDNFFDSFSVKKQGHHAERTVLF